MARSLKDKIMVDSNSDVIWTEVCEPGVAIVTINRPAQKNVLNLETKDMLARALREADGNPGVNAIILVGSGGCFVAGTDLNEQTSMTPTFHSLRATDEIFTVLRQCKNPLIAAVEGYALGGGCELALACDMIVAGRTARFGLPEIRVGVMPGAGGTQRLIRTIGKYKTMRIVLTGEFIEAKDAFDMGFVSDLTDEGDALQKALELAKSICRMPPLSVRAIKEVAQAGADMSLESALLLERKAFQVLFDSDDQAEGMNAFIEKRKPEFKGR